MSRRLLVAALAFACAFASTAHAAPAPQITDPQGDWQVPSQDILSARVSSLYVHGTPTLRAEVKLAAAPDPNLPAYYVASFDVGCLTFELGYSKDGPTGAGKASLWRIDCTSSGPFLTTPAGFSISGTTLTMQVPYALGLKKGMKTQGFAAWAYSIEFVRNVDGLPGGNRTVFTGDVAHAPARTTYVLGSDLPRR